MSTPAQDSPVSRPRARRAATALAGLLSLFLGAGTGLAADASAGAKDPAPAAKAKTAGGKAPAKATAKTPVSAKDKTLTAVAKDAAPPAPTSAAPPPADSSPMADLKKANAKLKKVLGDRKPSWSPEADVKNAELKKIVGSFLDFEELARRSLGKNWDARTPKERTEFVKTLRELVERNYVQQIYGQPEYELKLDKETKNGSDASVTGVLHAVARGKKVTMELEYKLVYKSGAWVVYDVITDDLSLLENYRSEFNKIIAKESFDALLSRMKKKLADKPAE
jgi:phospholipid transport system substrate-binding protein